MRWPWVARTRLDEVKAALIQAVAEKRIAEDRLYAAWKDGYTVPPRESVVPAPPKPVQLLPPELAGYVQNWESAEVRQELEAEARRLHYDLGYDADRVIALFEARRNGGGAG